MHGYWLHWHLKFPPVFGCHLRSHCIISNSAVHFFLLHIFLSHSALRSGTPYTRAICMIYSHSIWTPSRDTARICVFTHALLQTRCVSVWQAGRARWTALAFGAPFWTLSKCLSLSFWGNGVLSKQTELAQMGSGLWPGKQRRIEEMRGEKRKAGVELLCALLPLRTAWDRPDLYGRKDII